MKAFQLYFFFLSFIFFYSNTELIAQQGNCLRFDGEDDFIDIGELLDMGTSDFTLEFWMNMDTFAPIGNLRRYPIAKGTSIFDEPSGAGYAVILDRVEGTNQVRFALNNNNIITAEGFETHQWYHITVSRLRKKYYIYVNGEIAQSGTTPTVVNVDTNGRLGIGTVQRDIGNTPAILGKLDEVRIWNFGKTPLEIQADMNNELTGSETGLLAYYDLNQGIAGGDNGSGCPNAIPCLNVAIDKTPNHYLGILNNFSLIGDFSNWIEACVVSSTKVITKNTVTKIYPNPTSGRINISNETFNNGQVKVIDVNGKIVLETLIDKSLIDISQLAQGVYFLYLEDSNQEIKTIKKVIKHPTRP